MKITRFTFIATILATLALSPLFTQAARAEEYKIAVVDMPQVIKDYNKREDKYKELQTQVDKLQAEIEVKSTAIEAKKKKFEDEGPKMDEDTRFALKQEIEKDFAAYKSDLESRQRTIDGMEEKVLKEVIGDIKATIQAIATGEGYHLVLNSTGAQGAVVYSSETIDITSKVLAKLNGGAPAPSSESPSKGEGSGKKK